ncbi:MAG: FAD-binding oxidoreductase [Gemmatimonadaceae bacterium]
MVTPISAATPTADFVPGFSGELVGRDSLDYEVARRVHNGLIDKHPVLVARCRSTADVAAAVSSARRHGLEIAVRAGGHNVAGRATVDDGLVIDLSLMRDVRVDPEARTARAQGGATWGDFNRATQAHGLATTGGIISTTGVAGLTLGGGLGWLLGRYGLSVDNLLSAEVVTADGRTSRASAEENPDLFWAIRGAGANFGVATALEFRLHPVGPIITGGLVAYPVDQARDVLRFYRELTARSSDDLTVYVGLVPAPDGSGVKLAGVLACHCGDLRDGEAAVRPIKQFGPPAMDAMGPMPYADFNSMLDGGYPRGALNYWKATFIDSLTDDVIDAMIDAFARCPSPMGQIVLEHVHGAAARVDPRATAFAHRGVGYSALVLAQWTQPADTDRNIRWARESYAALEPFGAGASYVNYLGHDEGDDRVVSAYGPNYARLRELKGKYDPDNVFHLNQNIPPASSRS